MATLNIQERTYLKLLRVMRRAPGGELRWEDLVALVFGCSHAARQDRRFQNMDIKQWVETGVLKERWDDFGNTYLSLADCKAAAR